MEKRFRILRFIGSMYKILGVIAGVMTILTMIGICTVSVFGGAALDSFSQQFGADTGYGGMFSGALGGLIISIFALINGGGLALTLYALGEGVYLMISLEENTREIAEALKNNQENKTN